MTETNPEKALHYSTGKVAMDQLPAEVLYEWAQVFSYGEQKYFRDNWKRGNDWHEFVGSALRHVYQFMLGQDKDPESGLPHLAHAIWNLAAIRYYQIHGLGNDDRPASAYDAGWTPPEYKKPPIRVVEEEQKEE